MTRVLNVTDGAIDVHTHFLPESYHAALARVGMDRPDNIPSLPEWSLGTTLAAMDSIGIAASVLSVSSPGVILPTQAATVALARQVNDECAEVVQNAPGRLGFLASLPQAYLDLSLEELDRALGDLGADGVILMTNANGSYVSDPGFAPALEEMSRREAVALLHPASPPHHEAISFGRPTPMIEFPFETTRTVADLILSGATSRFPGIRWIIPHGGAALSVLAARISWVAELLAADGAGIDVNAELGRLHYDLAGAPLPIQLPAPDRAGRHGPHPLWLGHAVHARAGGRATWQRAWTPRSCLTPRLTRRCCAATRSRCSHGSRPRRQPRRLRARHEPRDLGDRRVVGHRRRVCGGGAHR